MRPHSRLSRALVATAAVLVATLPPAPAQARRDAGGAAETCTVAYVIDGDTLDCRGGPRIRLIGIDAPEMDQGTYGAAARAALERLAPRGARLHVVLDVERFDRRGRTLAYLYAPDGTFINVEMARNGFAVDLPIPPNTTNAPTLRRAVIAARAAGAGLWPSGAFRCSPAAHRRGRC